MAWCRVCHLRGSFPIKSKLDVRLQNMVIGLSGYRVHLAGYTGFLDWWKTYESLFSALSSKLSTKTNETVPSRQNFHLVRDIFKAKLQLWSQSVWGYIHFIFPPTTFLSHQSSSSSGLHFVILIWSIIVRKVLQQTTLEYTWGFEGKGGIFANFSSIVLIDAIFRRHKGESYYTQEDIGDVGARDADTAVLASRTGPRVERRREWIIWTWPWQSWHLTPVKGSGYLPVCSPWRTSSTVFIVCAAITKNQV